LNGRVARYASVSNPAIDHILIDGELFNWNPNVSSGLPSARRSASIFSASALI
jgi:hypothetical protein